MTQQIPSLLEYTTVEELLEPLEQSQELPVVTSVHASPQVRDHSFHPSGASA